jgi:AraC family transcriptional regulator
MKAGDRTRARLLRGVERIERHIGEDVALAEIASAAALSQYHFHRLFRSHFGIPVRDYVRRRRLAQAADALLHSRDAILEIALEAGFQSQAAFSRAFRKVYHRTPMAFRRAGRAVPWLSSAPISEEALALLPGLGRDRPKLRAIDGFEVAGIGASFDGAGRERIPQLWQNLFAEIGTAAHFDTNAIGVCDGGSKVFGGMLDYMAAVRVGDESLPASLTRRSIPGGAYLVFDFSGAGALVASAYDYIFGTWMPGSRHVLRQSPSFTCLSPDCREGEDSTVEIWIPLREP